MAFSGTIQIKQNPVTSWESYSHTFSASPDEKTPGYFGEKFTQRAEGGFYRAEFSIRGPYDFLSGFMQNALGREVTFFGDDGSIVWEGYIHEMEYDAGSVAYSIDLGDMANAVWVRYRVRGTSTTVRSGVQTDANSIAKYGRKEFVLSGGELESTDTADDVALQYLDLHKWPVPGPSRIDPEKELEEYPTIKVSCRGWFDTINWTTYNQTADTDNQGASAQIIDIIGGRTDTDIANPSTWDQTADLEEGDLTDFDATSPAFVWDQEADLEEGDLTDFDSTSGTGLAATTDAALAGSYGMAVTIDDTTGRYGVLSGLTGETTVTAEFTANIDDLTISNGNIFQLMSLGGFGRIDIYNNGGTYYVRFYMLPDVGFEYTDVAISSGDFTVRYVVQASSGVGNDDGFMYGYLNGELVASYTGIDNDTKSLNSIEFGAVAELDAGTSGTLYMDDMRWSNDITAPYASTYASLNGSYGMAVGIEDTTARYADLTGPANDTDFTAEMEFHPNSITMSSDDSVVIMAGIDTSSNDEVCRVSLKYDGSNYLLFPEARLDDGTYTPGSLREIPDDWTTVKMVWRGSSGSDDGRLYLLLDGAEVSSITGLDNDTLNVDTLRVGAVSGIDAGTSGVFWIDHVRWSDDAVITVTEETGVGQFVQFTDMGANATSVSKEYDADRRGGDIIRDIARLGDSEGNRWIVYMDKDRTLKYERAAPPTELSA